jgi:hypothetical protein
MFMMVTMRFPGDRRVRYHLDVEVILLFTIWRTYCKVGSHMLDDQGHLSGGGGCHNEDRVASAKPRAPLAPRRRRRFIAAGAVSVIVIVELLCYAAGWQLQRVGLLWKPPVPDYDAYLALSDPLLGWAGCTSKGGLFDGIGSRFTPAFPNPEKFPPLVSLYGDSWTFSWGVSDEFALGNALSRRLGRRVNNFGDVAWGTDQAYLRFKHNFEDKAKIVVLGHLSDDVTRNVNRCPNLRQPMLEGIFKPRFVLTATGELRLVPCPSLGRLEYADWVCNPERHLTDEYFLPGGPSGVRRRSFPYSLSAIRAFNQYRVRAQFRREPRWAEFYRPDHPSGALAVTVAIIRAFVRDAQAMGKVPVVAIYPHPLDLAYRKIHGRWVYQPLLAELDAAKIPYFEAGEFLVQTLGNRDPDSIHAPYAPDSINRHPNAEGYRLHAEGLHRYMLSRGILPR